MPSIDAGEEKSESEISITDVSDLIVGVSRLLGEFASLPVFKEAKLGLAEWAALSMLDGKDGVGKKRAMSNKQLARGLSVTPQRANQITISLSKSGLISVVQSAEDSRRNDIKISDAGKAQFDAVNAQLTSLLNSVLKNRARSLSSISKRMRQMVRVVQSANPGRAKRRGDKTLPFD